MLQVQAHRLRINSYMRHLPMRLFSMRLFPMRRATFFAVLFMLPVLLGLILLGNWQMARLVWKTELIERIETRLAAPIMPLPPAAKWPSLEQALYEYRRVQLTGRFDHSKEQYWYARSKQGAVGVHVITPFQLTDGASVLVNRGFVPQEKRDPKTRLSGQIKGQVQLSGLLHWSGQRKWFNPPDEPEHNFWFVRDVAGMAKNIGLQAAPFFVDVDNMPAPAFYAWPLGGQTHIDLPNRHLGYALTWYGLALVLVIIFALWHLQGRGSRNKAV